MKVELNGSIATVRNERTETLVNVRMLAVNICTNPLTSLTCEERAALAVGYLDDRAKIEALGVELRLLRDACDVGAILSRRIKDESGRVRHADAIVDDMIKLIDGRDNG